MNRFRLLGSTAALLVMLGGCVTTQDGPSYSASTGKQVDTTEGKLVAKVKPGAKPSLDTDAAGLRMMYDKAERSFKTSGNVVRDPELNRYVSTLVCKIAGPYCGDIRVYIIRAPYFNANMGPNGAMQVWTGLLLRTRNEAQLVAVLGHEIGHYLRRHSLERMRNVRNTTNALAFFQLAAAGAGVAIVGSLGSIVAMAQITAYSRDQERDADRFGHQFLVEHKYDPREAARVWAQLIEEQNAEEDDDKSVFLASHPLPDERQETLWELADSADGDGTLKKTGEAVYNTIFLPHRKHYLRDELNLRRFERFEALLDMLIEEGKQVAELYFFRGEIYRLRDEEGDIERAIGNYKTALSSGDPPPELHRSLGQLQQKLGKGGEAKASYQRYLEALPEAEDAEIIRHIMGKLS